MSFPFECLVLLELVGALGEDPGEDDAVVQPAGDGNEVGDEVDRQGQIGESAEELARYRASRRREEQTVSV